MSTPATSPAEKSHIAVTQNDLNGSVYIRLRTDVNFFEIILLNHLRSLRVANLSVGAGVAHRTSSPWRASGK
jgi:hypothetical protein